MIRFNSYLPAQTILALKTLAKETGLPLAEHIRRAIDSYLASVGVKK
jgi:predicted DNA-binding protein